MKISVTDGMHTIIYQLNDSPSAKSLYSMLPMDIEVEDYGSNEKIFYPRTQLDCRNLESAEGGSARRPARLRKWVKLLPMLGIWAFAAVIFSGVGNESTSLACL